MNIEEGPVELARSDCISRLLTSQVGRIALSIRSLPMILPVSYRLDRDDVLVSTVAAPHVVACVYRNVVTFQVDDVDFESGERWSVSVTGLARPATVISPASELRSRSSAVLTARIDTAVMTGTRLATLAASSRP